MIDRFAEVIRTGRILVNAPTAVGALGGVYNSLTPTFSLGCGTWGGSTTTDNVNYSNLLNIKTVSPARRRPSGSAFPPTPTSTPGALESLRQVKARQVLIVTDTDGEARGAVDEVRRYLGDPPCTSSPISAPSQPRSRSRPASRCSATAPDSILAVGGGSVLDAAKAMRLFHESPELALRELALPFLDARKRVAHYPEVDHSVRLVAMPTTAGTGSEVSPAAVITAGGAR